MTLGIDLKLVIQTESVINPYDKLPSRLPVAYKFVLSTALYLEPKDVWR